MPVGALCRPRAPQNRPMPQPRAIPARRWSSSRRSPWPAPWGSSGRHFDPTDTVAVAQGSFSPPQSDTSATTGAHRELAAGRSTAAVRNRGNTSPRRPHAHAPEARGPQRERRGMDLVHHGPCLRSMDRELASTVDHACGPQPSKSPRLRRGRATARHVSRSARPRPAQPEPTRAQFGPSQY